MSEVDLDKMTSELSQNQEQNLATDIHDKTNNEKKAKKWIKETM